VIFSPNLWFSFVIYKMTPYCNYKSKGKIPAVKIANQWRFRKEDIDKWLQEIRDKAKMNKIFLSFLKSRKFEV